MRVLLTNDDGIQAPGLATLHEAVLRCWGDSTEVFVVAPHRGRSECGHSVTTGRPLKFEEVRPGWISVDGTPVDCVRAALTSLIGDVDLVLSGVNAGANLGIDLLVSGTFAAAREAALHNAPAMAVSHYRRPDVPATWSHVPRWLEPTLQDFAAASRDKKASLDQAELLDRAELHDKTEDADATTLLWNVNLPAIDPEIHLPAVVHCDVDTKPMVRAAQQQEGLLHLTTDFHGRPRDVGKDVESCFAGHLTISKLPNPFQW